jgi:hypothetical protein
VITEFFIWLAGTVVGQVLDLLPDGGTEPGQVADGFQTGLGTVIAYAGDLGFWVPWGVVPICLAIMLVSLMAGGGVRFIRMVISHLTGGGGA